MADDLLVLKPSRATIVHLMGFALAMTAGGVFLAEMGYVHRVLAVLFGGVGFIVSALKLALWKLDGLQIDDQGFSFFTLRERRRYSWSDCSPFSVRGFWPAWKSVAFNHPDFAGSATAWMPDAGWGPSGGLPENYGMSAIKLAALMNERRELAMRRRT